MLTIGETYNERKATILENIKVCRDLIRATNETIRKYPSVRDDGLEVIQNENNTIKDYLQELVELERWRIAHGLAKDEPYQLNQPKD